MDFMNRIQQIEGRINDIQGQCSSMTPPIQTGSPDFQQLLEEEINGQGGATALPNGVTAWNGQPMMPDSASTAADPSSPAQFDSMVADAASENGVDPNLVKSVIQQESAFNPKAVSNCGAMGMMQLMPDTAKALGCSNAFDPQQNIQAGTRYLKSLLDRFNGDTSLALAAYNAGPNAVEKYNGIPPFAETQNYVKNILGNYAAYKRGT